MSKWWQTYVQTIPLIKSVSDPERNDCSTFNIFQSTTTFLTVVTLKLFKHPPFGHFMRNEASDIQRDGVIFFTVCRFLLLYYSFPASWPNAHLIMVSVSVLPERFSLFNCLPLTLTHQCGDNVFWVRIALLNGPTDIPECVQKLSVCSVGRYGDIDWMLKHHHVQWEGQNSSRCPPEWEGSISRLQNHGWRMDIDWGSILSTALD